jgi:GNAT superfamily N-acetyltransferase
LLNIKKASAEDIPLIRKLTFDVWPQTYAAILSQEQLTYMLEMMYSETSLKQQMDKGNQFIIVCDDAEPVGFAAYMQKEPDVFKLDKIYVLPSQQGKGTGKFVIDYIINIGKQQGVKTLLLQVNRHNKAKSFYEKVGFVVTEETDFDIGNGYFMNDYVMELIIN